LAEFSAFFSLSLEKKKYGERAGGDAAGELPEVLFCIIRRRISPLLFTRRKRRNGQRETRDALKTVEEEELKKSQKKN